MKIFLLLNPPTVTAQESKVALVKNKTSILQTEKSKTSKAYLNRILKALQTNCTNRRSG